MSTASLCGAKGTKEAKEGSQRFLPQAWKSSPFPEELEGAENPSMEGQQTTRCPVPQTCPLVWQQEPRDLPTQNRITSRSQQALVQTLLCEHQH